MPAILSEKRAKKKHLAYGGCPPWPVLHNWFKVEQLLALVCLSPLSQEFKYFGRVSNPFLGVSLGYRPTVVGNTCMSIL